MLKRKVLFNVITDNVSNRLMITNLTLFILNVRYFYYSSKLLMLNRKKSLFKYSVWLIQPQL